MTAPPDLREFDEKIAEVRAREGVGDRRAGLREGRVAARQGEAAAGREGEREKQWKAGDMDVVAEVDEEQIAEVSRTGPASRSSSSPRRRPPSAAHGGRAAQAVIGQERRSRRLQAIRRTRAGLKDPKRPTGSFIFAGPSGVGKTELAKALAEFLFGDEDALIQLDMSRVHGEAHRVAAGRLASRLRRLRRGRPAHREGAAQAVLGGAVRRDREGAPGRLQHAAADPGGRPADRRSGPHGRRLQEHDHHHDHEPRHADISKAVGLGFQAGNDDGESTTSG
jgi:hypothetical protein